ncbi:hypothetical protein RND81_06G017000 [Saponaria officinalis]|uniref:Pectinesterase n=1 Tax=Saponaria officinalis TaxID=3572 RepID=A0AAW1K4Z1_SAPOF
MNFDEKNLKWVQEIYVDRFGMGDFETIQKAIDVIPSNNSQWKIIRIEPGIYREKIIVPNDKSHIILSGRNAKTTIITGDLGGGIRTSPTVTIFASNFVAKNLTIENKHKPGIQAVALKVVGDKVIFHSCRFLGYQDTLLDDKGRHFYQNCYIQGATDFICGNAASLFDNCHIHSISPKSGKGAITAQRRQTWEENTGFYFTNCKITGLNACTLGRPWGNYSRVVFANTQMSNVVLPYGWDDWNKPFTHKTVYYGEHNCYGPGANRSSRVTWSRHLTYDQALPPLWFLD